MFRTSLFALAASALLLQPALAEERIAFDRDSLSDPAKVAALYAEIEAAAHRVCRRDLLHSPYGFYTLNRCVKESVARAVAESGSPELVAYAEGAPVAKAYASAE